MAAAFLYPSYMAVKHQHAQASADRSDFGLMCPPWPFSTDFETQTQRAQLWFPSIAPLKSLKHLSTQTAATLKVAPDCLRYIRASANVHLPEPTTYR